VAVDPGVPDGREDADFAAFVTDTYPALLRTGYLLTGDLGLAEDLVQTVLAKLYLRWSRLEDVRRRGALTSYARTALTRQSISWWRRSWRAEQSHATPPEPPGHRTPDAADQYAERDRMVRLLAQLPARQRAAVTLRYLDDLTQEETAAALGCTVGTAKSHIHRGVTRLRELMESEREMAR